MLKDKKSPQQLIQSDEGFQQAMNFIPLLVLAVLKTTLSFLNVVVL